MDHPTIPPQGAYRTSAKHESEAHPFEAVLEALVGRTMTQADWLEEANKSEDLSTIDCLACLFTGAFALWFIFSHGSGCVTPASLICENVLWGVALFFVILALFFSRLTRRNDLPNRRWRPEGCGMRLLEKLLNQEITKMFRHLQGRFEANTPGWENFEHRRIFRSSRLYTEATFFYVLLDELHCEPPLPFTDPLRWETRHKDPGSLNPESRTILHLRATHLLSLVNALRALQKNPCYLRLSPELCSECSDPTDRWIDPAPQCAAAALFKAAHSALTRAAQVSL